MKLITRFAIAFALVLVVIVGLGTTAVSATNALPGDLLYPIKTSAQNAQLMLTWDAQARQALENHFQEEYRNDVRLLSQDGRQVRVRFEGTLDAMENHRWVIGGLPVSVDPVTTISGNPQLGNVVLVEADVQTDGSILASRLAFNSTGHPFEDQQTTPVHTPVHTFAPEHQQENLEHASPTSTLVPNHTPEHQDDPTRTPAHTVVPLHPTESVHREDENPCQTCGGSSGGDDGGHDGEHEGNHDSEHDSGHD